ncbi:hypothetical protein O6H91_01G060100 [Diphasiastrum complanatum]|uniref:Uncharacterized protein n=1 Tax=Diphasiastrum complanatum TaxID=34168 RepID=A0ACC2ERJ5_DIPCM|nr:hypothetical protein O6H91_01G060100 [Diphasiastrum complanatum]
MWLRYARDLWKDRAFCPATPFFGDAKELEPEGASFTAQSQMPILLHSNGRWRAFSLQKQRLSEMQKVCQSHEVEQSHKNVLVVIGGGAAGIFGALRAKAMCSNLHVVVLEKGRLLSKVKVSGGGRCNVTTGLYVDPLHLAEQYPRGCKELKGSFFRAHGPSDTADWFLQHGVLLKTEEDGRMFPVTDDSSTIVNCLVNEAKRLDVLLQTGATVNSIKSCKNGTFSIEVHKRGSLLMDNMTADFILLATGSARQGYKLAAQLGHTIIEPRPSLFTFKVSDPIINELKGVSFVNVQAVLEVQDDTKKNSSFTQVGPLLITHWGLSGPVVLRLSAWAARELYSSGYQGTLWVDFVPSMEFDQLKQILAKHREMSRGRKLGSGAPPKFMLVRRFWQYLLMRQGLDVDMTWSTLSQKHLDQLVALMKRCSFTVDGKGEFKEEFVTAGGVPLFEVDLKTMQSKKCSGLYLAGEILNVDGVTGGFNFQNAWTGGFVAGSSVSALAVADCA